MPSLASRLFKGLAAADVKSGSNKGLSIKAYSIKRYREGASPRTISDELTSAGLKDAGVSPESIQVNMSNARWEGEDVPRQKPGRKPTAMEAVARLMAKGLGVTEIAERTGMTPAHVRVVKSKLKKRTSYP